MKVSKPGLVSLIATVAVSVASAATTIHVDSVTQRWPWNNKVDITYTVTDGQDVSASKFYKIVFTTVIDGTTYTIDGSALGASANTDTHTVTWNAPAGLRCANCTMSAAIYDASVPSGNDYMIIDLTTGEVAYEGLFATQAESDSRYNTDKDGANIYKESKLVLRKVPAGSYPVLRDTVDPTMFKPKTTDRDFYIGIYPVTQKQYEFVGADSGATPSYYSSDVVGNPAKHRPVERVLWADLRTDIASTSDIPAVASANTGTFLQRLRFMTGNDLAFDLPTDLMFSIAARAGTTKKYYYGSDEYDQSMFIFKADRPMAVGSKVANAWGLYDVNGNIWEWGLDTFVGNNMEWKFHNRTPFVPNYSLLEANLHTWHGGDYGSYSTVYLYCGDYVASDSSATDPHDRASVSVGFRVSVIMD